MKKALLTLSILSVAIASFGASGQINYGNKVTADGIDAPVRDSDGALASGSGFMTQLYAAAPNGTLQPMGSPLAFRTGSGAGYWVTTTTLINNLAADGGLADVQARAWKVTSGSVVSWETATIRGESNIIEDIDTANPNAQPAETVGNMIGLQGFNLSAVPEPTTLALGAAAAAGLLFRRRKSKA